MKYINVFILTIYLFSKLSLVGMQDQNFRAPNENQTY